MSQEPKKVGRRTFLNYAIAVIATGVVVGAATYFAVPKGEITVTAPGTTVTKTVTVTGTPTTTPTSPTTPTDPYKAAAYQCADWVGEDTVLSRSQLIEELEFFAEASKPYRGKEVLVMYESIVPAEWEVTYLGPWFEKITGIKIRWESMSNWETVQKSIQDQKTKAGLYDVIGSDQDMIGFYSYYDSSLDIDDFMEKNPDLVPPHFDKDDFYVKASYSDYRTGHMRALLAYNVPHGTAYRADWFENSKYQQEFKAKYGYELKSPMEYYLDAQKTGDVGDDWTTDKALDVMEFFTRKEENMYGFCTALKPGDHMGWWVGDGWDDVFQLASPAPSGKNPLDCTYLEPNTTPWGCHIENNVVYGFSTENGGTLDSEAGCELYDYWLRKAAKFVPDECWQFGVDEAYSTTFAVHANCAMLFPFYCSAGFLWNDPTKSNIAGKFKWGPIPVYAKNYEKGKPRGYIDPSGWVISNYSKNKEIAWLFSTFMTSKAFDLKKSMDNGTPIRKSSLEHPKFAAQDKKLGGLVTLFKNQIKEQFGSDARMVFYPIVLPVAADKGAEALQQGLSGDKIAKYVAKAMDDTLKDTGWYKKSLI
ncbi:MAG: extracellular solute-binding protein [Nitrososphaeria archaeon]